jgi:cytochrome P450
MLRISPDEVSFNDLDASGIIYGQASKFEKTEYFYRAFEDQAPNLFTIRDRQQHAQDKRLISHAFSRANIVQHQASIFDNAAYLMDRIAQRVKNGQTIPLFPAFRCMTLDTISEFAFGRTTGALKLEGFDSGIFEAIDKATGSVPFVSFSNQLTRT